MKTSSTTAEKVVANQLQSPDQELLTQEAPLEIRLHYGAPSDRRVFIFSTLMRTPGNDFELAVGFLYTVGGISRYQDIVKMYHDDNPKSEGERGNVLWVELAHHFNFDPANFQQKRYKNASLGINPAAAIAEALQKSPQRVPPPIPIFKTQQIHQLLANLRKAQTHLQFKAVALFEHSGSLTLIKEDYNLINAIHKLIGIVLTQNLLPLQHHILVVNANIDFDVMQKILTLGVPVVAGVGNPTSLAYHLATDAGITMLSFTDGGSFAVYTGKKRLSFQ
ncbi:formate dehydrogenase accessory sulfurtransferase FdhD [Eisenibacter elegans]|uniref:formate dehydrogenase accessory sulfurtransferase FdhD n=1 Tax=Eisenibacter elegans TaxID=997 RepID=UPI00041A387F|nr:formate dehydrogenase accessory sulfurtransferase FdhD [Eisenibacter elegans]